MIPLTFETWIFEVPNFIEISPEKNPPSEVDWGQMGTKIKIFLILTHKFTLSIPIVSFLLNGIRKILFSDVTNWKLYSLSSAFVLPAVSTVAKFCNFLIQKFKIFGIFEFPTETCDIATYPCYVFSGLWTCYTAKGIFNTGGFTVIIIYDEWKVHSLRTQRENSILASGKVKAYLLVSIRHFHAIIHTTFVMEFPYQ